MDNKNYKFTVFTKPWQRLPIDELGKLISGMGFDGIEFPLRDGYQVEPKDAEKGLPKLVKQLQGHGLEVCSVASDTSEKVFAGCAEAGIPIIRIIVNIDLKDGYFTSMERIKREMDAVIPLCEKYGIKVGIQQHFGPGLNNSMEMLRFVEQYDPKHVGAIWDSLHSAYAGEEPEQGLDIAWSHLCMVNLKNGYYKLSSGLDAEEAKWDYYFSTARKGLSSWTRVAEHLKNKSFKGILCLTAEYSEAGLVNKLIAEDIAYAKTIFKNT